MKQILFTLLTFCCLNATAQNPVFIPSGDDRYKQVAGRYGGNSGVCLFDDGKFLLYGYATMVFGSYVFEKDYMLFYPDKYDRFMVFASKNKAIGDSVNLYFQGFEDGITYIRLDNDSIRRVFNPDANCLNNPYVYKIAKQPANITLFEKSKAWWLQNTEPDEWINAWKYSIDKGYNDLMLFYNREERVRQDFAGVIEIKDGRKVLKLSNYGGDGGYIGQKIKDDDNWERMLEYKNQYYQSSRHIDTLYANRQYNTFDISESGNYRYDAALDEYVDIYNKDNDSYYQDNAYNDSRYLRKYVLIQPQSKDSIDVFKKDIAHGQIFFSSCDTDKRTYKYDIEPAHSDEPMPPPSVAPAAPYVVDTAKTPDYKPFQPFTVDREDGFYEVKHADHADYSKTVLARKPALGKEDIESVTMGLNEINTPTANIKIKKEAAKKLEQFTTENLNKPVAVVVNKKVITMPVVVSPIEGGKICISGLTKEELEEIIEDLQKK